MTEKKVKPNNDSTETESFKQLSEEEQQAILQKYDPESNTRSVDGIMKKVIFFGLLAFSIFQLYTAIQGQFTAYIQRSIHLGFALSLIFLMFPAMKKSIRNRKIPIYDYLLVLTIYWSRSLLADYV